MTPRTVFDDVIGQPKAGEFLRSVVASDQVSHAYLFVGPPGAGKKTAARALACAIFCKDGGCGTCPTCARVRRGTHPDVHVIAPEGASGYLAEQVRDIIRDTWLAPVEGPKKVYIVESADVFNDSSANAFLKTLEEPPDDVVIILLSHRLDAVLPTIASRCQVVRFRRIPPAAASALLREQTGAEAEEATSALAASGGVIARAREFLASPGRRAARATILRTLKDLPTMDELDVLDAAKALLTAVKAPLEEVKAIHAAELEERTQLVGGSLKPLQERQKRELTAREREGVAEVLNVAESWLRDCLVLSQGLTDLVLNADAIDAMEEVAAVITPGAAARALEAVTVTRRRISYNVSPQLAIEAMLFDVREVLRCPR